MSAISEDHVLAVCKPGKGAETCSFFAFNMDGPMCAKGTEVEPHILRRLAEGTMSALGDNCDGWDAEPAAAPQP